MMYSYYSCFTIVNIAFWHIRLLCSIKLLTYLLTYHCATSCNSQFCELTVFTVNGRVRKCERVVHRSLRSMLCRRWQRSDLRQTAFLSFINPCPGQLTLLTLLLLLRLKTADKGGIGTNCLARKMSRRARTEQRTGWLLSRLQSLLGRLLH